MPVVHLLPDKDVGRYRQKVASSRSFETDY